MMRVQKILFPTDFSRCSTQALTHALFLAERFDATLQLFHAVVLHADDPADPDRHFPGAEEILRRLFEIADSEMAALIGRHRQRPVKLEEHRARSVSAAGAILDHAREHDVDLIVMGTHGRRGPARLFFGSVAEEVVRFARAPVMTMRELDEERPVEAFHRVLAPIDFSSHSRDALTYARELAALYGAELQLLHVIEQQEYPSFYAPFGGLSADRNVAELETKSLEALSRLVAEAGGPSVPTTNHVAVGRPSTEIAGFAEKHGSDLIVTATHGLTGLERLLVGSTAEQVVRTSPAPVFLVKSFGKSLVGG